MYSSHGICQLMITPIDECYEQSLLKVVLLRVDGGMVHYLSIAEVGI